MVVRVTMDLCKHPYYRLNKMMMSFIGQWPYQSIRTKRVCHILLTYFYVTEIMSRIRTIYNNTGTSDIVMGALLPIFQQTIASMYFVSFILNSKKTFKLLNRIRTDWQVWAGEREVNILRRYTEIGQKINIAFAVMIYCGGFLIGLEPTVEKIIDILLKNGTEPGKFIFLVDYYHVDEQKYYFYVTLYFDIMCVFMSAPELTNIVMLISYTAHGSGIFAALRHKLECIGNNYTSVESERASHALDDRDMVQLAWCIDRHNDAIEYANLIEAAYTWNMFISTGLGMILINTLGLQVLTQINDRQVTMVCGGFALGMGWYFLMECIASQILIDHSISIRVYIYNSQWYRLSPKAQKLLQYMTMRCNIPCQLTAGNMLIMSIRTVWIMFKTVMSYFAFIRSTQGL